jgi:hypothetical protein
VGAQSRYTVVGNQAAGPQNKGVAGKRKRTPMMVAAELLYHTNRTKKNRPSRWPKTASDHMVKRLNETLATVVG